MLSTNTFSAASMLLVSVLDDRRGKSRSLPVGYQSLCFNMIVRVWLCVCVCVPELKVPLASSGDTSLDRRDIMTPSRAFKKTKTRIEPQMYCIDEM